MLASSEAQPEIQLQFDIVAEKIELLKTSTSCAVYMSMSHRASATLLKRTTRTRSDSLAP